MSVDQGAAESADAAAKVCGCVPNTAVRNGVVTGCACEGIEQVVERTKTRSVTDVLKVIAFAVVLAALVAALVLWI